MLPRRGAGIKSWEMSDDHESMNHGRTEEFVKNPDLEGVLTALNQSIAGSDKGPYTAPRWPVILIVGCPRSGTTLMLQWLAHLGCFGYPSNLVARFFANPWVGALAQRALVDLDQQRQLAIPREFAFSSKLGRTQGALAPSEFWYFWRHHLGDNEVAPFPAPALRAADSEGLRNGLAGLEAGFGLPVAMKGMIMNWNIPWIDQLLDRVLFVEMRRPDEEVARSLLRSRQRFFGTTSRWYSFKPPEYSWLRGLTPEEQVAGQVIFTKRAVALGLEAVPERRKLTVPLADLVDRPAAIYQQVRGKFLQQGCELPETCAHTALGSARAENSADDLNLGHLREALDRFANG
jgi:hypothetical protein